jgi:hypothetical protein
MSIVRSTASPEVQPDSLTRRTSPVPCRTRCVKSCGFGMAGGSGATGPDGFPGCEAATWPWFRAGALPTLLVWDRVGSRDAACAGPALAPGEGEAVQWAAMDRAGARARSATGTIAWRSSRWPAECSCGIPRIGARAAWTSRRRNGPAFWPGCGPVISIRRTRHPAHPDPGFGTPAGRVPPAGAVPKPPYFFSRHDRSNGSRHACGTISWCTALGPQLPGG